MSAQPNVKASAAAAIVPAEFEPIIRNLSESLYDKLLGDVQDYMIGNVQFNIGSTISSLEHELKLLGKSHAALLELALQYRDDLKRPPSADSIERRLAAVNEAIARATGAA